MMKSHITVLGPKNDFHSTATGKHSKSMATLAKLSDFHFEMLWLGTQDALFNSSYHLSEQYDIFIKTVYSKLG